MSVEIGNRLMQYRKKAGLSQEELADKLGVSRQAVSKWECGESSPDTDNLIALAKIYNVSLDELIYGKEEARKKGIHIEGKDGEVHVEGLNIHLKDDDGSEVHIGKDGVHIIDNETGKSVQTPLEKGKEEVKASVIETIISSCIGLVCVVAYILIGCFVKDGWRNYWIIFFLIPIVPSLMLAIRKRKATLFAYPVLAVAVFLGLGLFLGLWHPTWVIFITIPIYYTIFGTIEKARHDREHQ